MEPILQEWAESLCDELGGRDAVTLDGVRHIVRQKTADMASMQYYRDFATVLSQYVYSYLTDQEDDPAIRWLKGEYDLKSNVRKDLGVSTLVDDSDWYEIIKLWTRLFVTLGYKGMVVFLDEAVVLYKLQNKVSRSNNYERLLTMFNDIMQGKSSYLSMYVCGTPEFIQDSNSDNYLGPVINLRPLSNEEIFVLLRTVKGLHEQRYGYTSDIDDRKLEIYLKTVLSGSVSSSMLTPREITRDLISLLDTLHQNPQATFEQLVQGRKVANDRNPDDDIIEDLDV